MPSVWMDGECCYRRQANTLSRSSCAFPVRINGMAPNTDEPRELIGSRRAQLTTRDANVHYVWRQATYRFFASHCHLSQWAIWMLVCQSISLPTHVAQWPSLGCRAGGSMRPAPVDRATNRARLSRARFADRSQHSTPLLWHRFENTIQEPSLSSWPHLHWLSLYSIVSVHLKYSRPLFLALASFSRN